MTDTVRVYDRTYYRVFVGQTWDAIQDKWPYQPDNERLIKTFQYYSEMHQWVIDRFGPELDYSHENRPWFASNRNYYFLNKDDYLLFVIRWLTK